MAQGTARRASSRVLGSSLAGIDGVAVEVEVRISSQLPRVDIVGLPEAAVRESTARVRAAISAIGCGFPDRRITVNLAPAALRKAGAGLDLPIAVGILATAEAFPSEEIRQMGFIGELALDGRLRPVRGALALVIAARNAGCKQVIVPVANADEAAMTPGVDVIAAANLAEVVAHVHAAPRLDPAPAPRIEPSSLDVADIQDVRGQEGAKRALEICAAGAHPLLLNGPPGSGKTMLARRLPGLLPPLTFEESLEATRVHSAGGLLSVAAHPIVTSRPFRAPHHTASPAGLLGGGNPPLPGEISLAHRGVLFLDELPEFTRRSLESLRQVLEERRVCIARARHSCVFPAHFLLIAASNPCPCGWYQSGRKDCLCDGPTVARYRERLSGPLRDRIDLHLSVPPVSWNELDGASSGPCSAELGERIAEVRELQAKRSGGTNAEIPDGRLDELVAATPEARTLLGRAVDRMCLSARGARRVLRVGRTIADLAGEAKLGPAALSEALSYRPE